MPEKFEVVAAAAQAAAPESASVVDPAVQDATWDSFVAASNPGSYLQTSGWAHVKAANGWSTLRFSGARSESSPAGSRASSGSSAAVVAAAAADEDSVEQAGRESSFGVQLLVRRPRLFPWAFAYAPRGPVLERWNPATVDAFTQALRQTIAASPVRVSHVRIEPEIEMNGPVDVEGSFRHALRRSGWRPATPIQPPRTRQVDLTPDESVLWGDLRKKWRQYVNKARRADVRVVEAGAERLPEFYAIYQDTARRAGFVIRTYESYVTVWREFEKRGMARLLMADGPDGSALATLFLLRVGDRVVEPYGGMTEAGAECRANYLLKWESMRTSRDQGAASYDMWGISHEGIEHFKAGFGGREIKYVGAWDLVLDPIGRLAYDTAQVMQDRIGAWRHGIRKVRGRPHAPTTEAAE